MLWFSHLFFCCIFFLGITIYVWWFCAVIWFTIFINSMRYFNTQIQDKQINATLKCRSLLLSTQIWKNVKSGWWDGWFLTKTILKLKFNHISVTESRFDDIWHLVCHSTRDVTLCWSSPTRMVSTATTMVRSVGLSKGWCPISRIVAGASVLTVASCWAFLKQHQPNQCPSTLSLIKLLSCCVTLYQRLCHRWHVTYVLSIIVMTVISKVRYRNSEGTGTMAVNRGLISLGLR